MKQCAKCKIDKELTQFFKNRTKKDGVRSTCKPCDYASLKGKRKASSRRYYLRHKEEISMRDKIYRENNKEKIHKRDLAYKYKRYRENPKYRAIVNARLRIANFLRNKEKFSKSLGCSHVEFVAHIESQFQSGMTWENYGKWHIDHKIPLSVAHANGPEFFKKSCNYTNLQPLWAIDNLRKAASVQDANLNDVVHSLKVSI